MLSGANAGTSGCSAIGAANGLDKSPQRMAEGGGIITDGKCKCWARMTIPNRTINWCEQGSDDVMSYGAEPRSAETIIKELGL